MGKSLKVGVISPPEKGKANEAMREVLAQVLEIPKSYICVIRGETSPQKTIEILGMEESVFLQRMESHLRKKTT